MTNVVVVKQKRIVVTPSNTQTGIDVTKPITVRNTVGYQAQNFRLDHLNDVVEGSNPASGDTLVYDATNDKYVVKKLSVNDLDGDILVNLDGGTF